MDPFSFAPIAALFSVTYSGVAAMASLLVPLVGAASAAVAIILLTLLVRTTLIPIGLSQAKAEAVLRRLAPELLVLRRKYGKNPQLLQQKTMALYKAEHVSPLAGILPAIAQAPVLSLVYALFLRASVDGHVNALLTEHLFGVPLGTSFVHLVAAGVVWPGLGVFAALFAIMTGAAWLSRRVALRQALPAEDAVQPGAGLGGVLSWLPFITVVFAAFVPLAATLYLATTTSWTLVERAILRRRLRSVRPK